VLNIDKEKKTIIVQSGIRLGELSEILWREGLSLPNIGRFSLQTVGGAIQTSTHASSLQVGNLSTSILNLELISGSGKVHQISSSEGDLFSAARIGLGSLGVVSTVTFQCVSSFMLEKSCQILSLDEAIRLVDTGSSQSNEYFSFYWIPYVDKVRCTIMNSKGQKPTQSLSNFLMLQKQITKLALFWGSMLLYKIIFPITLLSSFMVPFIFKFFLSTLKPSNSIETSYDALFDSFAETLPRWSEVEYFVSIENFSAVMKELRSLCKEWNFNFPSYISFVSKDDIWLSESYEKNCVCFCISIFQQHSKWDQIVAKIDEIMGKYGGRPHWAKYYKLNNQDLSKLYLKWADFQQVRETLDPERTFLNNYLEKLFI